MTTQHTETIDALTKTLKLTDEPSQYRLSRVVTVAGESRAKDFAHQAVTAHRDGGMWYRLGGKSHRRSLGGCFFRIAKDALAKPERREAWRSKRGGPKPCLPLRWPERLALLAQITDSAERGKVFNVRINIVGRPKSVIPQDPPGAVIVLMREFNPPEMPKGLPRPGKHTDYAVYISGKQWRRIEPKLKDRTIGLYVEGYPVHDENYNGITVLALSAVARPLKKKYAEQVED